MKKLLLFLFITSISSAQVKYTKWDAAQKQSQTTNKNILIILTGAEWCKPCVKMEKNVMQTEAFIDYANENLVLFEINIPRHMDYDSKLIQDYQQFKKKYQVNALPALILVDKDGNELMKMVDDLSSLEKVLQKLKLYK